MNLKLVLYRLLTKVSQVIAVGGSYAIAVNVLHEDWIELLTNELDISFNFDPDYLFSNTIIEHCS